MDYIYLIPKKLKPFHSNTKYLYIKDIYEVYPKNKESIINEICIREYKNNDLKYDVIHLGEIIERINENLPTVSINFLRCDDIVIFFDKFKNVHITCKSFINIFHVFFNKLFFLFL